VIKFFDRKTSERQRRILSLIVDVVFLVFLLSVFLYTRDVHQKQYEICLNPSEYCPFSFQTFDRKQEVDWGLLSNYTDLGEVNKTKVEENVYKYLAKGLECS